jgi:hypothetical protein
VAAVDARAAAGADRGPEAGATAAWLRGRLRLGAGAASGAVGTARARFRGPLAATAAALTSGASSPALPGCWPTAPRSSPTTAPPRPNRCWWRRRVDSTRPGRRRAVAHLRLVADPDGTDQQAARRHGRRGLWLSPTWEGMVAVDGLVEPEAGQSLLAALEPLARPADATDTRSGGQRPADALAELARRAWRAGRLPQAGGVRPQLTVTVELETLLGRPGRWVGRQAGRGRWILRRVGGWPVTGR